jgi:hydrogenase nickel incorporation protein HypA/HybF
MNMHELAMCQGVVTVLQEQAAVHRFSRVTTVRLEIGALSCVSAEAIEFCFAAVTRGTLADGCRLELLRIPGEAFCLDCNQPVPIAERQDPCPRCGGERMQFTRGDEMRILDLEVT